jgi:hypothetical protein
MPVPCLNRCDRRFAKLAELLVRAITNTLQIAVHRALLNQIRSVRRRQMETHNQILRVLLLRP